MSTIEILWTITSVNLTLIVIIQIISWYTKPK